MKYGILFLTMASIAAYAAIVNQNAVSRTILLLVALSLLIVAIAYLINSPALLLKRTDGNRSLLAWVLMWPHFTLVWFSFWTYRLVNHSPPSTEISDGIWLSRRLLASEASAHCDHWAAVVDLASEFPRTPIINTAYLSLPVLDGTPPTIDQLQRGIEWINDHRSQGPVLVHCALGHGRSASIILAWMVFNKSANGLHDALKKVQNLRPGVGLSPAQFRRLVEMFPDST